MKARTKYRNGRSIEKRANLSAWQIFEEIGLSKHSVDRVSEIIAEKISEQKAIDIKKAKISFNNACGWLSTYPWYNEVFNEFMKNMEEQA